MHYRPASPTELERIQALLAASALPAEDLTPALLAGFLVATDAGTLVGCVGLEQLGDCALLRSLAVEPAHRGRGIAERLFMLAASPRPATRPAHARATPA